MNTRYLEEIGNIFENQNLNYKVLENLSISEFDDYKCYYLLVENSILYVISIGEANSQKSQLFFKNLQKAAQLHSSQKLTFIMDATQLYNIPASVRREIHFFDLSFRKYWAKVLFIYQGVGKVIMDMYSIHKPEQLEGVEKVGNPYLAVEYAINGRQSDILSDDYLNSLTKDELIAEIKRLKAKESIQNTNIENNGNEIIEILTNLSWEGKNTKLLESEVERFNPIQVLINTVITDYKQLARELEEIQEDFYNQLQFQVGEVLHQEATLRAIFDSLESIVWMIDADFNLLAFNSKFYKHVKVQYGIVPEVGMNLLDQKEISSVYEKTISRIKIALNGTEENYRDFYEENGRVVKVVDSKVFPVMVNKHISGVVCITDDITESFEAKEKIKSNERIIASVNKNISEAIYRSTHDKGLIFINEAFVKMFGFDSKEELYHHAKLNSLYANPDDRERLGKLLVKKKEVTNVEVQFQKKNGDTFTGLISSMVSLDEEGSTYFDGAIRDVTAIKSAQEKLKKQNRELKKLNTELDSFVYSASHDLKAPLSSVKGLINLAKDEDDKEKLAHYLDLVDKSINKLDDFIKDIVDLSRNARQEVSAEPIDFNELIQDTLDNYQYLQNYDRIEKKISVESDVPFYSDKRRLKVILNNLISNSIRYFNPFIDDPYVEIVISANETQANISISDNGLGIENQYLEKIFDMFFRASNSSKGTGIGLYIVRETIQKIQGEIHVKSKIDKGTKFTLTIPNLKF
ncbi:PAS domain S-box-containing protein [Marivirga sericea]|uniref:histidine kinase n=1 Tax=Marivirga sericea TaxID=1028 RepID=A0A1X7K9R5_9BACT|nr:PAS domain-containing sensor histidine kinase [Marivirga sericea]SMG37859.1 PAS domain S-box-containing protein [Marivirga sericea]